jgi:hypothetical protein
VMRKDDGRRAEKGCDRDQRTADQSHRRDASVASPVWRAGPRRHASIVTRKIPRPRFPPSAKKVYSGAQSRPSLIEPEEELR